MGSLYELGAQVGAKASELIDNTPAGYVNVDNHRLSDIAPRFGLFDQVPTAEGMSGARQQAIEAMKKLTYTGDGAVAGGAGMVPNGVYANILRIGDYLQPWDGLARDSFDDNVKSQVHIVPQALFIATSVLAAAIDSEAALWKAAQADVRTIGEKALSALEASQDKDSGAASFELALFSAVVTTGLAIATAGGSLTVEVVVTAVAEAAGAASPAVTVNWGDTDDNPDQVVTNLLSALDQVESGLQSQEATIQKGLDDMTNAIQGELDKTSWDKHAFPTFLFKPPSLASQDGGLGHWVGQ